MQNITELKTAVGNNISLIWADPNPIEDNDYNINYIEPLFDFPNDSDEDTTILINYGQNSEAEVFLSEIKYKNTIPKQYIYKLPFTGSILTSITNGVVDYTGEPITTKTVKNGVETHHTQWINGLNFEQYNEKKGGDCLLATAEQMDELMKNHDDSLCKEFTETTEDRFFNGLECLPPKRWHTHKGVEIFFVGECYTSNIYTCYARIGEKHFSALRRITATSDELVQSVTKNL